MSSPSTETTITTQPTYAGDEAVAALVAALKRYQEEHEFIWNEKLNRFLDAYGLAKLPRKMCLCGACKEARAAIEMAAK